VGISYNLHGARTAHPGALLEVSSIMARRSADSTVNGRAIAPRCSDRFLDGLAGAPAVTFVSHVNPDPDSLGSMFGLAHLVDASLGIPTRMTRDGIIGRAENSAMVELLGLELVPVEELELQDGERLIMVDSQPKTGRHTLDTRRRLYGVIDHHDTPGDLAGIEFVDVRNDVGATCSVVANYMMEQKLKLPVDVATALFYGIETELNGYPREASALDDE